MSALSLPLLLCDQLRQRCQPPYADNEAGIVEVLRALQTCDMTLELLHATKVGLLLNSVRRQLSDGGAAVAKQLIAQWKEVARSTSAPTAATTPPPLSAATTTAPGSTSVSTEPAGTQQQQ